MMKPRQVQALKPGASLFDPAPRGVPKLEARGTATGARFVLRYVKTDGTRDRLVLGDFCPEGRKGLTLAEARDRAGELVRRYQSGERDLRAALEAEQAALLAAEEAARAAEAAEAEQAKDAELVTLAALCMAYADHLERNGRTSAPRVRQALTRHVIEANTDIARKPASEVTPDDALAVLEKLTEAGSLREAAKMRAYLRAAYALAINAKRSPGALPALRRIGRTLTTNPVRDLGTVPGSSNTKDRVLSVAELRAYWKRLGTLPEPAGPLLRVHLLTGGQRLEQLARATVDGIDEDEAALLLLDTKGRRTEPRRHWVPLLPQAKADIELMRRGKRGPYVFTASQGERPAIPTTVQHMLRRVSAEMVEKAEATQPFTAGDVRRTVETRLAALGVSMDVRAHLQSHGLGGLQARHYDRHSYSAEKRQALRLLVELMEGKPATVTPLRKRSR